MSIQDMIKKYNMKPHEENGLYAECHYHYNGEDRAPSGSTYFFVGPGEITSFHQIDCDEYWCYNYGSSLEVWIVGLDGRLEVKNLGIEPGADPVVFLPKGVIFGSRNLERDKEGTFFTCITVPRFDYRGFRLVDKDEVLSLCGEALPYWEQR